MKRFFVQLIPTLAVIALMFVACISDSEAAKSAPSVSGQSVAVMRMDMAILPGTQEFLEQSLERAARENAAVLIVELDTPGGMLETSQQMIQAIFKAQVPVIVYVSPSGGTATSAGVFLTMAGHVAAMAPGTSIGAAHPVMGDGKDIQGDMRAKAENMTIAMVKAIAEQRGRNVAWAEKAVKSSDSITEKEALKSGVVDLIASDTADLVQQLKGREVKLEAGVVLIGDLTKLPVVRYEPSLRQVAINVLANPNVAALLWLGATTGLSIELYNPGLILPGVVGLICLILALAVSQVIPISQGAVMLLVAGAAMIGLELFVPSGVLGVGGVIAIVIGAFYLIDPSAAPGLAVDPWFIGPIAFMLGSLMVVIAWAAVKVMRAKVTTGAEGLEGAVARAVEPFTGKGRVFVNGALWNAVVRNGAVAKDEELRIVRKGQGLTLEVEKIAK